MSLIPAYCNINYFAKKYKLVRKRAGLVQSLINISWSLCYKSIISPTQEAQVREDKFKASEARSKTYLHEK
jgi:hypothetical protein